MNEFDLSEDEMFAPIKLRIERAGLNKMQKVHVLANYMFMGYSRVDGKMNPEFYAYKHTWTREYIHLRKHNGEIMTGNLDTSRRGYINEPETV